MLHGAAFFLGISYGRSKEYVSAGLSPSLAFIPYCHQTPFISKVLLCGKHI